MRKVLQYLLLVIATISVGLLGYYAYTIATDTLRLPFVGQEKQSGAMRVAFSKPWLGHSQGADTIDRDAMRKAILKNGETIALVSGEVAINIGNEYIEILPNTWKKNDSFTISSRIYNQNKNTPWKLSRDITTTNTGKDRGISISKVGRPKDLIYRVMMSGYEGLRPSDLRWYIVRQQDIPTSMIPSTGIPPLPTVGPAYGCSMQNWNSSLWSRIHAETIESYSNDNGAVATYKLKLDNYPTSSCLVAGIGGDFAFDTFGKLPDFTATGIMTDALSPEYGMRSRIEFSFSSDIYTDSGALYSPEYLDNRHQAKTEFLKHLSISDGIDVTEDQIELTPNRATLYLDIKEGKTYTLKLSGIEDIYGRKLSTQLDVTPKSIPYLGIKLVGNKTIIRQGDSINANLYHIKTPKSEYEVKLCRTNLESFSRVERINEMRKKEFINTLYDILGSSTDVSGCVKKTIAITPNSYISKFTVDEFYTERLTPGLYILALRNKDDVSSFEKYIGATTFSVVDTNITMKIDASGKLNFLVTDIRTGSPIADQSITIQSNQSRIYNQKWNTSTQKYDFEYLPLSSTSFGTGMSVGRTGKNGVLNTDPITLKGEYDRSPYSMVDEWQSSDGRNNSFLATSTGNGHFGYVVSTWNDGITGWNFGLKESDYSWYNKSSYSVYAHTDRRLYLPGETVYYKAIIRQNNDTLSLPKDELFEIQITDNEGKNIHTARIKANEFGSIATNFIISKDAKLGYYNTSISLVSNPNLYLSNAYTSFQVEIFKNPTFTAEVKVSSPQVENDIIKNIRELPNVNPGYSWYENIYQGIFTLQGRVGAHYYNGAEIKSVPFTYRIYKSRHYDENYWNDCFWGCYYEGSPEFYTEGTGSIDSDGVGIFRTDIDFSSYSEDYVYTAEVTVMDPLSGETVTTPGTLLVRIPAEHRMVDMDNPLKATIEKRLLHPGDPINLSLKPSYGRWDQSLAGKYQYEIIRRTYREKKIDTVRDTATPIIEQSDTVVDTKDINTESLNIDTKGYTPGEYILRVSPIVPEGKEAPSQSITESMVYLLGDFRGKTNRLSIIPEKTIYHQGEIARLLITTPFASGGYIYLTRERGGVLQSEYIELDSQNYTRDYPIDESFYPNVYIGAVAFPKGGIGSALYAVGYSEVVMDLSDKKAKLDIKTNADTYKNRDTVSVELALTDFRGQPQRGEIEMMVIDESLIRLLGNIDLDVIPKFFQKYPFTMKTALTLVGLERNKFLSRLGSNGGSGDKGGDGTQISSRTLFKNTAYYNASIITDANGNAKVSFVLPDNVTNYRIITIGQTKDSKFAVTEKTIAVRRDYSLETHAPYISYAGDTTSITASIFNNTKKVTPITLSLVVGTGATAIKKSENIIINPTENISRSFTVPIDYSWSGDTPYTITIQEGSNTLDSIQKSFRVPEIPRLMDTQRIFGSTSGSISLPIPKIGANTNPDSLVTISLATSPLQNPERIIKSMVSYPYGCIEQTISSTLPNAIALEMGKSLGINIDTTKAQQNLNDGVTKILRMQDPLSGGWKYWESDNSANNYVTPYVVRALFDLRALGAKIPDSVIEKGLAYVATIPLNEGSSDNIDNLRAEVFATLAKGKHEQSLNMMKSIDTTKLNRHGYLMYHIGLNSLGKLDAAGLLNLKNRMSSRDSEYYWYWSDTADRATYARLLYTQGQSDEASTIIMDILQNSNLESYYMSTQEKTQIFLTLIEMGRKNTILPEMVLSTTGKVLKMQSATSRKTITTKRSELGDTIDIQLPGSNNGSHIYYQILLHDSPVDIFKVAPLTHPDLSVDRVFEKVDEAKGLDANGQFISAVPVKNGVFEKGSLYRVRISVTPKNVNSQKYYLTLEDFLPGGWRPIRGIFKTESSATSDHQNNYWYWNGWNHVEALDTQILASRDMIWPYANQTQPYTYTYYIRPEYIGSYLLPPVTAYYMYQPEIHAFGKYEKITVQ